MGQTLSKRSSKPEKQFVTELALGVRVQSPFVLSSKEARFSKDGRLYVVLTFSDRTGSITGVFFDPPSVSTIPSANSIVNVVGLVDEYRAGKRIKVTSIAYADAWNSSNFVPHSARPIEEMSQEYGKLVCSIEDQAIRNIIRTIFGTKDVYKSFCEAPLSVDSYGSCIGGALEHTLNVARLVDQTTANYPQLSRDMLLGAALLHEVGCIECFDVEGHIKLSQRGAQLGALVLSGFRLHGSSGRVAKSADIVTRLEAMILCAHGAVLGASPIPQDTSVLALCDSIDMTIGHQEQHIHAQALVEDISAYQCVG